MKTKLQSPKRNLILGIFKYIERCFKINLKTVSNLLYDTDFIQKLDY